jgi:hypothetical protein
VPDSSPPIENADDGADNQGTDLQFDHAELTTPNSGGPTCDACKRPISDAYYEINGKVLCTSCRQGIEASLRGGSPVARVLMATLFGFVGALAGAALYYAILRGTGYHVGLVAVLVGFMVGGAVRKGTGGRGGLFYQFLALFLTYTSIVAFHVPLVIEQVVKGEGRRAPASAEAPSAPQLDRAKLKQERKVAAATEREPAKPAAVPDPEPVLKENAAAVDRADAKQAERKADNPRSSPPSVLSLMGYFLVLIGFFYALPLLVAKSDPLSGLILCFALWEAWKVTKGVRLAFNGPFRVSAAKPETTAGELVGDGG